jgi:hypothetical protein
MGPRKNNFVISDNLGSCFGVAYGPTAHSRGMSRLDFRECPTPSGVSRASFPSSDGCFSRLVLIWSTRVRHTPILTYPLKHSDS